jgi:hypothetical protein
MENSKNRNFIKQTLREGFEPNSMDMGAEAPIEEAHGTKDNAGEGAYGRLKEILSNDIINHAGVIRRMKGWGDADATARSLFRKKLHQEKNDEGGTYEFEESEVEDIFSILMDVSKKMAVTKRKGH